MLWQEFMSIFPFVSHDVPIAASFPPPRSMSVGDMSVRCLTNSNLVRIICAEKLWRRCILVGGHPRSCLPKMWKGYCYTYIIYIMCAITLK